MKIKMENKYYAITRSGTNDELQHWKYIKKLKKNGKWRYYYDYDELKKDVKDVLGYDEREELANANYLYKKANESLYGLIMDRDRAGERVQKALKKYNKTPLGMLDRLDDVVDSGRSMVSKLLSKASKKIKPKKEDITKYRTIGDGHVFTYDKKRGKTVRIR